MNSSFATLVARQMLPPNRPNSRWRGAYHFPRFAQSKKNRRFPLGEPAACLNNRLLAERLPRVNWAAVM
jgi:hypothetical protein